MVFHLRWSTSNTSRECLGTTSRISWSVYQWIHQRVDSSLSLRCVMCDWLVVYLPLWKIWNSVGIMTFPIYGKIKNVPNHQPGDYVSLCATLCDSVWLLVQLAKKSMVCVWIFLLCFNQFWEMCGLLLCLQLINRSGYIPYTAGL